MHLDPPKKPTRASSEGKPVSIAELESLAALPSLLGVDFEKSPVTDAHIRKICTLPKLVNLGLEKTKITDAALAHVAKIRTLYFLRLDGTNITGKGLDHFYNHPKLEVLWLNNTKVTDKIIPYLLDMPRLRILNIEKTKITFDGLLQLAANRRLSVNVEKQFSTKQLTEFEKRQTELAHQKRTGKPPRPVSDADVLPARAALLAFFKEINAWGERVGRLSDPFTPANEAQWHTIINKHCTPAKRYLGSISKPPKHSELKETSVEQESKNKIYFHFLDHNDSRVRYLVTRKSTWLVEKRQYFSGGWKQESL